VSTEKSDELTTTTDRISPKVIQRPDSPVVFANICNIIVTDEDARLVFGIKELTIPGKAESVVTVFTTMYAVKRLQEGLTTVLEAYERDFGSIETNFQNRLVQPTLALLEDNGN
jgi:hypothetical protein